MTRAGRSRDDMREQMGHAQDAHVAGGRPMSFGMGRGGAHAGSAAPCPEGLSDPYRQMQIPEPSLSSPRFQQPADPYAQMRANAQYPQYAQPTQYVPPATSIPQEAPKKKRKKVVLWIVIIAILICIALAVMLATGMLSPGKSKRQGAAGQLEGKTQEEIRAELDRVVDEGMFNISIAANVMMESGNSPAELRIENVPGNRYLMKVDIVRDDTGQKLYETDLIEPNHHIQSDTLDVSLPQGTYDCTAIFSAYDPETEESIGQAAAKMQIQVAK